MQYTEVREMITKAGILKSINRVVPLSIRKSRPVSAVRLFIYDNLLGHDAIYDSNYYASTVEGPAVGSAAAISESIILDLRPNTIVDVGCGTGALLEALRKGGCQVFGLEYSTAALRYCQARALDVRKFDLERDSFAADQVFDVAISMEVGEHLPEETADRYVDLLTRLSGMIVFTAAPPGQGGDDHVNEQPQSYWIAKFQVLGFDYDDVLSSRWSSTWREKVVVAPFYHENLMIFRRTPRTLA